MTTLRARVVLATSSLAIILTVVAVATALGPEGARPWLIASGVLALLAALQSVTAEPGDLSLVLLFSLPPVAALVGQGAPFWLIGALSVALLVASELNALSWDCRGAGPMDEVIKRRLIDVGRLAGLGLAASVLLGAFTRGSWAGGTVAVVLAAGAFVVLGAIVFDRKGRGSSEDPRVG